VIPLLVVVSGFSRTVNGPPDGTVRLKADATYLVVDATYLGEFSCRKETFRWRND